MIRLDQVVASYRTGRGRINAVEFDLTGGKDFHQSVVKEIYPLLGAGTLNGEDVEKIVEVFAVRANPYTTKDERQG